MNFLTRQAIPVSSAFSVMARAKFVLLAIAMIGAWLLASQANLSEPEQALWEKVHAAQQHIWQWKIQTGTDPDIDADPWSCGFIGVEWSEITTTLGDLSAKRTACNPAWAIQFYRWFKDLELEAGEPVVIYSSASFPALLHSAISAAEAHELDLFLVVSLGASTWGANHPVYPWPVLEAELRSSGFISKRADYYSLGGASEMGNDLSPEGVHLLRSAATQAGVDLLDADSLHSMINLKSRLLETQQPRLFVSIGGSHANMGNDHDVLRLTTGLVPDTEAKISGNGIIGKAMQRNIPVIHMLNMKQLSKQTGIPYDRAPQKTAPANVNTWWSAGGIVLFFVVLLTHKRWRLEKPINKRELDESDYP